MKYLRINLTNHNIKTTKTLQTKNK